MKPDTPYGQLPILNPVPWEAMKPDSQFQDFFPQHILLTIQLNPWLCCQY